MRAVNGYLDNGRFTPLDVITLPMRTQAVLVYNDTVAVVDERKDKGAWLEELLQNAEGVKEEERQGRAAWLERLDAVINAAMGEDLPDIPRSKAMREPLNLTD